MLYRMERSWKEDNVTHTCVQHTQWREINVQYFQQCWICKNLQSVFYAKNRKFWETEPSHPKTTLIGKKILTILRILKIIH